MQRVTRSLTLAILLGLIAIPAVAQEDPTAQARALFNAGAKAYETGKYPAAIQAFQEAYRLAPREGLLFSVAQAYRRQYFVARNPDDLRAAVDHYQKYLAVATEAKRRGEAADALAQLEPIIARLGGTAEGAAPATTTPAPGAGPSTQLMVSSPAEGARVKVDGKDVGAVPYIAEVAPGTRKVEVYAPGYQTYEREVRVAKGAIVPLDVELVAVPAALTITTERRARIAVNGRFAGKTPVAPLALEPGQYTVSIAKNGHRLVNRDVTLGHGEQTTLDARLKVSMQRRVSYGAFAAGGVSLLIGGLAGLEALDLQSEASELVDEKARRNLTTADVDRYETLREDRDRARTTALVATSIGAGIAGIGAVLYAFDRPELGREAGPQLIPPRAPGATPTDLAVVVDEHGAYASVRGAF